jgi:hypothetical protein
LKAESKKECDEKTQLDIYIDQQVKKKPINYSYNFAASKFTDNTNNNNNNKPFSSTNHFPRRSDGEKLTKK